MGNGYDVGVIGMAVMGQNLVLNMESHGFRVAVYNRTASITREFIASRANNKEIKGVFSLEELVKSLKKPRKIMLMVKAGKPVDLVIEGLLPYVEEGDIIIDGGNSHFKDTERRLKELSDKGIEYLGTGISGGEYGALHGPSIMPGGSKKAYREVKDILTAIAAETEDGPCVTYLGPRSSGHYVKMVHNGIEYGVMEVIAETYDLMRKAFRMKPAAMAELFKEYNRIHQSYLLEITGEILKKNDPETNEPLIDIILDRARQKGTGKWSVKDALDLGVAIPTINAAVNSRYISASKDERVKVNKIFDENIDKVTEDRLAMLEDALYMGIVIAYAEGMKLLQVASENYGFDLKLEEVARIWEDGCIIRSALLKPIQEAYKGDKRLISLLVAPQFIDKVKEKISGLRDTVVLAKKIGVPVPALNGALDYFDSLRSAELPANLIQGQRDYFGAHTYERRDREGNFHTEWQDIHNIT